MSERRSEQRKDRLIQTRVPKDLESTLKDEARKRRLSVSHLIRNVLEDTFNLVDNVVVEVDKVVNDSMEMAQTFRRDAARLAQTVQGSRAVRGTEPEEVGEAQAQQAPPAAERGEEPGEEQGVDLSSVYAWQPVVLNRPLQCAKCGAQLKKGEPGHMGLTGEPGPPKFWLCEPCLGQL